LLLLRNLFHRLGSDAVQSNNILPVLMWRSTIVDAIHKDGRLFSASWLPRRLQQVMTQCK
jgi:hypothetical protein